MQRGVYQLTSLQFRYCPRSGSSMGAREYIRNDLLAFAEKNPQISVKTVLGPGKHPCVVGGYLKGVARVVDLRNKTPEQIAHQVAHLRGTNGHKVARFKRPVYSDNPSIQGDWETLVNGGGGLKGTTKTPSPAAVRFRIQSIA